jgi:hypothetical protein
VHPCNDYLLSKRASAYSAICPFLDDVREGPIPSMYLVLRYLSSFSSAVEGTLPFTALDFSGNNVLVAGQVLYLRDIRYFVEAIIDKVKSCYKLTYSSDWMHSTFTALWGWWMMNRETDLLAIHASRTPRTRFTNIDLISSRLF